MTNSPQNPFKPKFGKPGNRGNRFSQRVLKKVKKISLDLSAGAPSFGMPEGRGGFTGERIGRGHWSGKYSKIKYGNSTMASDSRRVIIKSRIIKLAGTGYSRAASHLKYIEREGVGQDPPCQASCRF